MACQCLARGVVRAGRSVFTNLLIDDRAYDYDIICFFQYCLL